MQTESKHSPALSIGVLLAATLVAGGVGTALRQVGALAPLELSVYDRFMRGRNATTPDPRILVVGIDDEDITRLQQAEIPDETLSLLFRLLERNEARTIGLDLFRDYAVKLRYRDPSEQEKAFQLQRQFETDTRLVGVCTLPSDQDPGVAPPPTMKPLEQRVGFSDTLEDPDGVARRSLLISPPQAGAKCQTPYSLGLQVTLNYLGTSLAPGENGAIKIKDTEIRSLTASDSPYGTFNNGGFQVLLGYRGVRAFDQVTLRDVINGKVPVDRVRNRVVLVGKVAAKDEFFTPYSAELQSATKMPGVVVHAQLVSQLLSAVQDKTPLLTSWPLPLSIGWIFGWSLAGGGLAFLLKKPLLVAPGLLALSGGIFAGGSVLFAQSSIVPVVPAMLGTLLAGGSYAAFEFARRPKTVPIPVATPTGGLQTQVGGSPSTRLETTFDLQANTATLGTAALPAQPFDNLSAGSMLAGRYLVRSNLSAGGFGKTYLAQDTQMPRNPMVVIKQFSPSIQNNSEMMQRAEQMFTKEAETLASLQHPQIPKLLAHFGAGGGFFLVQEFIDGTNINKEIVEDEPWPEPRVRDLLRDVLTVLEYIHSFGVIHRDIKPSNLIRRAADGRIVLIDFGAVKQIETKDFQGSGEPTIAIGTANYTAPEQFMGMPQFSSDLYALGIIAAQALTGLTAQDLLNRRNLRTQEIVWRDAAAGVSDAFAAVVDRLVRYSTQERFAAAREVLNALDALPSTRSQTEFLAEG